MVSRVPQNGFIRVVLELFSSRFTVRRARSRNHRGGDAARGEEKDNKNNGKGWKANRLDQLARWMSARIDRAAQTNSRAPSTVVTAADSNE